MTKLFLDIYDFFETRRSLLFGMTLVVVCLLTFLSTRVEFDEKITDIFPRTEEGKDLSMIFDNLKSKDRFVVLFSARDAGGATAEDLMEACDDFAKRLSEEPFDRDIASVTSSIDSDEIARTTDFIYNNLPIFLSEEDYARIDSLLLYGGIDRIMAENFQRLLSPVGIGLGMFMARDPLSIAGNTLKELQNFNPSMSYRLMDEHIFSDDLSTCLLTFKSRHASNDTPHNEPLVDALDDLIRSWDHPAVKVQYFGTPAIAVYNARQIKNDTYLTLSLAMLLIVVIITCSFRNRWAVLLITLPVAFGGLFALSCIALTVGHISLIAIGAGAAVLGIAISYSTHVVSHANHTHNAREIVQELTYPMIVGSFTTIGAFVGLMFTTSPLLNDFGLFAALTLVGTPLFSLIVLPHLLEKGGRERPNRLLSAIERFNAYPFEKNRPLVCAIIVLFGVGVVTFNKVDFDSDMSHLSYTPRPIAETEQKLEQLFEVDGKSVTVVATAENVEDAVQRYMRLCADLDAREARGEISALTAADRFIVAPSVQAEKIARWNEFWRTDNRRERLLQRIEFAGKTAGFSHGAFGDFAQMLNRHFVPISYTEGDVSATPLLEAWISSSHSATLVLAQLKVREEDKDRLYAELSAMDGVITIDRAYFANKMAKTVSDDFNYVLYMSGFLVFITLLLTYRRIELTLMTFAPMFIAFTIILGLMAVMDFRFNIVNIILSTFIFGIGDDFSIFIMDGLQREYSNGRRMLSHHKTAIFFSVLTTIIGIGALCFANHPVLRSTSIISIIGMTAVILSSYTILPLLFRLVITRPVSRGGEPYTLCSLLRTFYGFNLFLLMCTLAQIIIPTLAFLPISGCRKRRWMHSAITASCRMILWMTSLTEHKKVVNQCGEQFLKPAIVIANHHSFIDILLLLSLSPRLVMITNHWVWHSKIFGRVIRYLGFCCVDEGYEEVTEHVRKMMNEGYSVVIFPEGTRSRDGRSVGRFHKGAFYLAEELHADLVPILIYGTGMICSKRQPFNIRQGNYGAKILPRILADDPSYGEGYRQRTKTVSRAFKNAYEAWCAEEDHVRNPYFRQALIKYYVYKTDDAELKARHLLLKTHCFERMVEGVARDARIVIFGSGHGELALLLDLLSPRRHIIAYEHQCDWLSEMRLDRFVCRGVEFMATDYRMEKVPEADYYLFTQRVPEDVVARLLPLCRGGEVRRE